MTLITLLTYIAIAAAVLTAVVAFWKKGHKSYLMTYLQNFTGVLFIVSGWVKAVDPMGTAFKMEQYFAEFESTFEGTWMAFMSGIFPFFSKYAIGFSLFMIIFEIVLGIMLLMGHKSKLTSWLFLLLVGFFTVLTGFTFLTGYVPSGENFFNFSSWGAYSETNMRVTDCGCFGDFIKIVPKTSFLKDIFLLFPAVFFVFKHRDMHELFTKKTRNAIVGIATIALFVYCLSNYQWNLPHADFRPFAIGADVAARKIAEEEAAANVKIVAYKMKNKASGQVVELPFDQYMKEYKQYPKAEWDIIDQIKTKPEIEATKISDFQFADEQGNAVSEDLLESEEPSFMIVCYKLKSAGDPTYETVMKMDTLYRVDTMVVPGTESVVINRVIDTIQQFEETVEIFQWDDRYLKKWSKLKPFVESAINDGKLVFAVVGGASYSQLESFSKAVGLTIPFYEADDILLKTIVRSNPGVVLWDDGTVIDKWHIKKLPDYQKVQNEHF